MSDVDRGKNYWLNKNSGTSPLEEQHLYRFAAISIFPRSKGKYPFSLHYPLQHYGITIVAIRSGC